MTAEVVVLKYAVRVRATKRWWTERGVTVEALSDPDVKLYNNKKAAQAAARIVGASNAKTNETYHSDMPEAHDAVTIRLKMEVVE